MCTVCLCFGVCLVGVCDACVGVCWVGMCVCRCVLGGCVCFNVDYPPSVKNLPRAEYRRGLAEGY